MDFFFHLLKYGRVALGCGFSLPINYTHWGEDPSAGAVASVVNKMSGFSVLFCAVND